MNAKELRQAAELLSNEAARYFEEYLAEEHDDADSFAHFERVDLVTDHLLATVREDDDEPLTERFVDQFRGSSGEDGDYFYWDANVPMNDPRPGLLGLLSSRKNQSHEFAHIKTRGEFRALCRLLGVKLKENT